LSWGIYDELIEQVPNDICVSECLIGMHWTLIRSLSTGMALTPFDRSKAHSAPGGSVISGIGKCIQGMPVRKLAEFVKSWNPFEATLGLAAINSVLNSPERVETLAGRPLSNEPQASAFIRYSELVRGRKVAVVGRFPDLAEMAKVCTLTVLERNPGDEDLPDPACEYVLPQQDYVFITATALINKTLPRLLDLSRSAATFIVGPSTPFSPALFEHGVHTLAGTLVREPESVWRAAQEGAARGVFEHGAQMVQVGREEWLHRGQ